ncbi:MAG: DUF4349 domain-containing protein [Chitinophaga sp.]|uniref:DUF4349 domain-containing protein n=1 Tax=Chitinophaga sp. TaxID=1869181 RepID=UPI001B205ABE|nr:DUF4349 domain-containing protein [Chitinophaga sp.]MBO9730405.1 DUF4349 domain-containing protein [Chitinophaga sp.]
MAFIALFIAMFLFRILYGYTYKGVEYEESGSREFLSGIERERKNYASEKTKDYNPVKGGTAAPSNITNNQKYEKVASVRAKSSHFTEDEKLLHSMVKQFDAIVQYQQESGNKGSREIQMLIGVLPEKFDSFYHAVQGIGTIRHTAITKTDKTNEYRKLNAKKISLEQSLASLNELKKKPGEIKEFIDLDTRISEVETELQGLGVELGNFDSENEFCTVQFSMYEGSAAKTIGIVTRLKVALDWTIKYYAVLVASIFVAAAASWILLKVSILVATLVAAAKKEA